MRIVENDVLSPKLQDFADTGGGPVGEWDKNEHSEKMRSACGRPVMREEG